MKENVNEDGHPAYQFLILTGITIGCMIVGVIIGMAIIVPLYGLNTISQLATLSSGSGTQLINSLWILQITSTTIPLFIAPVIFSRFLTQQPQTYLKTTIKIPVLLFVLVFVIMFFASPVMEWLVNINQKMHFPHWLQGVYDWMKEHEDEAAKETQVLLQMKTLGAMFFDLLVIGLLTAIAEEFLFRGSIQTIFTRWTKNYHWGIWITAILFSAFHLEFFGFLPRLMLGVFFGYFVAWSGSIWTGVWGHFINNGTAVVMTYLFQNKIIHVDPDDQHLFNYGAYAFSLIFTVFLFIVYRNIAQSKKTLPV
jgi:membrane protease YdiL (CAAX protease family)